MAHSRSLSVIHFTETSNREGLRKQVLAAFLRGRNCFQFHLKYGNRRFEDRIALPADADEKTALEMADDQFDAFTETISRLAANRPLIKA